MSDETVASEVEAPVPEALPSDPIANEANTPPMEPEAKLEADPPAAPVQNPEQERPKPTYADTLAFVTASPNEALEIYHTLDKALVEIGALAPVNVGEAGVHLESLRLLLDRLPGEMQGPAHALSSKVKLALSLG